MKYTRLLFTKVSDLLALYALKGIFFLAPFIVTYWALDKLARLILEKIEILLPGVSHQEMLRNNWWYALAFVIAFFTACLFGFIASRTIFGRNINDWSDKTMKKIKGVGQIYGFANDFVQQLERKDNLIGKPVVLPCINTVMLQVGHIMSDEEILYFNPHFNRKVVHLSVLFKSAYGLFTGNVFLVPKEIITEHESHYSCAISTEEALQFNFSGGTKVPEVFCKKDA